MRVLVVAVLTAIAAASSIGAVQGETARDQDALASEHVLVGQLLLPSGAGSRGVEVVATVAEDGSEPLQRWILFDEQGRFSFTFSGDLVRVTVSTGLTAELCRIEADELPEVGQEGRIDVGVIDLRDRLSRHRLVLRAAEGARPGDVRVAMCFGPPPVGPGGERVALGSRQFPPVALGSEVEWLLPNDAPAIFFLVERPVGSGREGSWRSGRQQLFGPFVRDDLPAELIVD